MRNMHYLGIVVVLAAGCAAALVHAQSEKTATTAKSDVRTIGVLNRVDVFNKSALVAQFNRDVDAWQKQLDAAHQAGDRERAGEIRKAYAKATAELEPTFDKLFDKALKTVCKRKGISLALSGIVQVAYSEQEVKAVDLTDEVLEEMKKLTPAPTTQPAADEKKTDDPKPTRKPTTQPDDGWS
ncbi:MAG: OmpH family outer membrane protein [Phycisphaerae bacterium]